VGPRAVLDRCRNSRPHRDSIPGPSSLYPVAITLFIPGKDPVPIVQEAGWASGPVWTSGENLALTRIRYPDRPARSQSLYRLSYPGPPAYGIRKNMCMFIEKHVVHIQTLFGGEITALLMLQQVVPILTTVI
jgi:hypothetical protein